MLPSQDANPYPLWAPVAPLCAGFIAYQHGNWLLDDPTLRGQGDSTPSQTAWAILGLLAAGDTRSDSVARGTAYLMRTQRKDGSWDEQLYTGTGFPRVFYLMYHLYRQYFPLLALTTYAKVMEKSSV